MSKPFIALFILISFASIQAAELIKVNGKESEDFQESAFVKLMANLNGGSIPYPFSKLLDSFGTGERENGRALFVPKGRSLVKESADYHNPRIITAPLAGDPSNPDPLKSDEQKKWAKKRDSIANELGIEGGDLFIGFAPNHKALEIISYNPKKPGYDFFVVEDYEQGKTPKIISNPSLCLSCHQNKGPIFPRVGWNEILGKTAGLPFDNSRDKANEMMERVKAANPERKEIEGIILDNPERFNTNQVAVFDSFVRGGNSRLIENEFCAALCNKSDLKCQETLIEETLNKSFNYSKYNFFKDKVKKISDIKISSSVIPNRDPDSNEVFKVFINEESLAKAIKESNNSITLAGVASNFGMDEKTFLQEMRKNKNGYEVTYHVVESGESEILEKNSAAINPATIRPMAEVLKSLMSKIKNEKGFNEKIKIAAEMCVAFIVPPEEIKQKKLPPNLFNKPKIQAALKFWPDTRKFNSEITKEMQLSTELLNNGNECAQNTILPVVDVYQYSAVEKVITKFNENKIKKPEAFFGKYCIQCHGGPTAFIPLPLDSAEKMAKYSPKFGTTGVQERLQKKVMPPIGAPFMPTDKERAEIVKIMGELKK